MSRLDDIQLKGRIVSIFRGDAAMNMVNFRLGQFSIGTMHFQILAGYIDAGRCKCSVDPASITTGAAAQYDPQSNTIVAKDSRLQALDDKVNLVHEATHALIDLMGGLNKSMKVTSLETETCAYTAGAIYKLAAQQSQINSGVKVTAFGKEKNIHEQADKMVTGKGLGPGTTNAGNPINFSAQDIAALQSAIKLNPLYSSSWQTQTLTDGM